MFVVNLIYTKSIEIVDQFRSKHLQFIDKYCAEGIFIICGRQLPPIGGLIIARCESKEGLENILKQDPYHQENVAKFEIIEFLPARYNEALEGLIKS